MKGRTFNSIMPKLNEEWSAKYLGMELNSSFGPDLIDDEKAVEIKFKLLSSEDKYSHKCWRVLGHQLKYDRKHSDIYWGLGFYKLDKKVNEIKESERNNLEKLVNYRELYLINWEWMAQFPIYNQKGKTEISDWNNELLFPKFKDIPKIISSKKFYDGKIFFTEGVDQERFVLNANPSEEKHYKGAPF